jgi:hypothetical protein
MNYQSLRLYMMNKSSIPANQHERFDVQRTEVRGESEIVQTLFYVMISLETNVPCLLIVDEFHCDPFGKARIGPRSPARENSQTLGLESRPGSTPSNFQEGFCYSPAHE